MQVFKVIFVVAILFNSCKTGKSKLNTNNEKENSVSQSNNFKLTEVSVYDYSELAGCGYIFKKPDGSFLIPINMPDTLKHFNLKLRIAFTEKKVATTCMAGNVIELTYVEYVH